MRSSQHSPPLWDELSKIQLEAAQSESIEGLRASFDRLKSFRSAYADDFDALLRIADLQDAIIERARLLRTGHPAAVLLTDPAGSEGLGVFEGKNSPPASNTSNRTSQIEDIDELDAKNWQRATYIGLFFAVLLFAAFFYLVQTARRLNQMQDQQSNVAKATPSTATPAQKTVAAAENVASIPEKPTIRLYTDLVPGTVAIDENSVQDLKDGELTIDILKPGEHTVKVTGTSGNAQFNYVVNEKGTPNIAGSPAAANAMAVLVETHDGQARLITNAQNADISVDDKAVGQVAPEGLTIDNLGKADHLLQVTEGKDRQRFVLTYTAAPTLTVYVKSDPNAGTVVVVTKVDGADVYINDRLYRRKTESGQLRIPLKVGDYAIRVHKPGFIDPPPATVSVKKAEESAVTFRLEAAPQIATLQLKGALPGTMVYIDHDFAATTASDGSALVPNVKPGLHTIELRRDQALPKTFERTFRTGDLVLLSGPDVTLDRATVEAATSTPASSQTAPTAPPAVAQNYGMQMNGQHVRTGGGFVPYHVPHVAGHYNFAGQARLGGILKHGKFQWYAGYEDPKNYVLFIVDGKHATVRTVRNGKASDVSRIPFEAESNTWVQVDLAVKPNSLDARVKTPEGGWTDLGPVSSDGTDFTQGKVGFYIPDRDQIAVSNFRFSAR